MAMPSKSRAGAAKTRRSNYVLVFLSLGALTALEVLVSSMTNIPRVSFLLGMSFIKVMLVILYFMHLRSDSRWFGLIFFLPFLLVIPLLTVLPH